MPFETETAKRPPVDRQTLSQEDFIEYILRHTNDVGMEFRVYATKNYILVGIDTPLARN